MKVTQILFTAPMVLAVQADTKTQTRRAVSPQPAAAGANGGLLRSIVPSLLPNRGEKFDVLYALDNPAAINCPYGAPGDHLVVRETFYAFGRWETRYSAKKRRDEWHFVDMTQECGHAYLYAADHPRPQPLAGKRDGGVTPKWWKRPAIFMPRAASRITLEVVSVRVERLQDISRADARAEGAPPSHPSIDKVSREFGYEDFSRSWYAQLWDEINGAGAWAANPWVWAVEFRRLP